MEETQMFYSLNAAADTYRYDESDKRKVLNKPFIQDDDVVASDGHKIITIPLHLFNAPPTNIHSKFPYVAGVFNVLEQAATKEPRKITLKHLKEVMKKVPLTKVQRCEECQSNGKIRCDYTAETDGQDYEIEATCPICHGTGWLEVEPYTCPDYPIYFDDAIVISQLVSWLIDVMEHLGLEEVNYYGSKTDIAYFKDDASGIRFALTGTIDKNIDNLIDIYDFEEVKDLRII